MANETSLAPASDSLTALHLELVRRRIRHLTLTLSVLVFLFGIGGFAGIREVTERNQKEKEKAVADEQKDKETEQKLATLDKKVAELEKVLQPGFEAPPGDGGQSYARPSRPGDGEEAEGATEGEAIQERLRALEAEIARLNKEVDSQPGKLAALRQEFEDLKRQLDEHKHDGTVQKPAPQPAPPPSTEEVTSPLYPEPLESDVDARIQALSKRIEDLEQAAAAKSPQLQVLSTQVDQLQRRASHLALVKEGRSAAALPGVGLTVQIGHVGRDRSVAVKVWDSAGETRDLKVELDRPQSFDLGGSRYEVIVRRVTKPLMRRDLLEVSLSRIP